LEASAIELHKKDLLISVGPLRACRLLKQLKTFATLRPKPQGGHDKKGKRFRVKQKTKILKPHFYD
jgi:hypothetical protein